MITELFNIINFMTIINKLKKSSFLKYVLFAVATSVLNILVYYLIYKYVIKNIIISNIFAYATSIITQFISNKKYVFESSQNNTIKQFITFIFTKIIAFIIDSTVLIICNKVFHLNNLISKILSNASTTLSNYSLNKKVVFK